MYLNQTNSVLNTIEVKLEEIEYIQGERYNVQNIIMRVKEFFKRKLTIMTWILRKFSEARY